jgi:hypothetical protein
MCLHQTHKRCSPPANAFLGVSKLKYIVSENAVAITYLDVDGHVKRIDAGSLLNTVTFEEEKFEGYEQCECCEAVQAAFTIGKHTDEQGKNVHYYMKVKAECVVECA